MSFLKANNERPFLLTLRTPETRNLMPLAEQWPYLRYLGLAFWWAWRWLCFNSIELMRLYPEADQPVAVFHMYLFSTLAIGCSVLIAAICWKKATALIDSTPVVIGFGLFAAVTTVLLGFSPILGKTCFTVFAICTGLGTSFLCLKVGRVYGGLRLGDSLTAGGISLVLAALLYFVGIGIPLETRLFYIGALPLISALFLSLKSSDQLEGFAEANDTGGTEPTARGGASTVRAFERKLIVRLTITAGLLAAIAGIGKGLSSNFSGNEAFAQEGVNTVSVIIIIAVLIILAINKQTIRRGVYQIYSGLMLLGVAMLLASSFGLSLAYLVISKESLWLVLSCFMAYIAFRYDLSPIWVFGIGQAVYFLSSTAGWLIGFMISDYYFVGPLHNTAGIVFAFLSLLILIYVFNGKDLSMITSLAVQGSGNSAKTGEKDIATAGASDAQAPKAVTLSLPVRSRLGLSEREVEVMEMFAQGRSASWIADRLMVSTSTVRSHIRAVYVKTGVHSRQDLLDFLGTDGK